MFARSLGTGMSPPTVTSVCSPLPSSGSRLTPVPHSRRYYEVVRLLHAHPGRLRSPLTARYLSAECAFVPLAGASNQPGPAAAPNDLAVTVVRMLSSARLTASTSATVNDFGAALSRPASSLPTLHPRQSPGGRQGSLPACPLRRWPGWAFTRLSPSRG